MPKKPNEHNIIMNGSITPTPYAADYINNVLSPSNVYIASTHYNVLQSISYITVTVEPDGDLSSYTIDYLKFNQLPWVDPMVVKGYNLRPYANNMTNTTQPTPVLLLMNNFKFIMTFTVDQPAETNQVWFAFGVVKYVTDIESNTTSLQIIQRNSFRYLWGGKNVDPTFLQSIVISNHTGLPEALIGDIGLDGDKVPHYTTYLFYMCGLVYVVFVPTEDQELFNTVDKCTDKNLLKRLLIDEYDQRTLEPYFS